MSAADHGAGPAPAASRRTRRDIWHRLGRQLARPEGAAGALMGRLMVHANAVPNRLAIAALDMEAHDHVLEIGFGPGEALAALARLAPLGRICGVEASPAMLARARRRNARTLGAGRMELVDGDFRRLPWADGAFDKVLAVNVAYFFDGAGTAVAEIRRVLKPGGRAVLYVTDRATMARWPFAGPETHVTYDAADLCALLARGGFGPDDVEIRPVSLPMQMEGLVARATRAA